MKKEVKVKHKTMPKTFKDLKFIPHFNRPSFYMQAKLELDNRYGISVVNGNSAFCDSDTYEVAILFCGKITYDTEFTDDVLRYQTPKDIDKLLINLDKMKRFEIVCNANITEDCIKTEKELREWANEIRENEGLKNVQPNFTETYDSNDRLRREGYIDDLWSCVEFLEEYDYSINEIK